MYKRVRDLREDRDLNQTEIAKILEMSQTGYSKYETGEKDYLKIWNYIDTNPQKWEKDCFYTV